MTKIEQLASIRTIADLCRTETADLQTVFKVLADHSQDYDEDVINLLESVRMHNGVNAKIRWCVISGDGEVVASD